METSHVRMWVLISFLLFSGTSLIYLGLTSSSFDKLTGQAIVENCENPEGCETYFLVCEKQVTNYEKEWHEGKCNPNNCGQDNFLRCEYKETYWTNYAREFCSPEKDYFTECSKNPNCNGDKEIKRIIC